MICVRCLVQGRVQGVWFRAGAREQALRLGLTGEAVNLPDGRVEVIACGTPEAVAALRAWLRRGTPGARVERLDCRDLEPRSYPGFATR